MHLQQFMQGYQAAWQQRDETKFCALFAPDGEYHNTPFAVQRGHAELAAYWQRVKLQEDVQLSYETLSASASASAGGGMAHWHVTYQVASEELFRIWAASSGTNLVPRRPGARALSGPARVRGARTGTAAALAASCGPLPNRGAIHEYPHLDRRDRDVGGYPPLCTAPALH